MSRGAGFLKTALREPSGRSVLVPSVFERLLDDNARHPQEAERSHGQDVHGFVQSVARDLEALLNTRCIDLAGDIEQFPLARESVLNYGTLDMCSLSMANPDDRDYLRDRIRQTIERHESRLHRIQVDLDMAATPGPKTLRFRVDAVLAVHPDRPPVTFDAMLQLSSSDYRVRGA